MNKKNIAAVCMAVLCTGMLFGCGSDKVDVPDATSGIQETEGSTTSSKFSGKKANKETPEKTDSTVAENTDKDEKIVSSELDEAQSFLDADMVDDAKEMLGYIDRDSLSEKQKEQYDEMLDRLGDENEDVDEFTPESVVSMVESVYGITINGDMSGMHSQIDDNGEEYYRIQIEVPSMNQRKIIDVYKDNKIIEVSSEPLVFG